MKNYFQIIGNIGSNILMNSGSEYSDTPVEPTSSKISKVSKTHTILSIASNNNYKDKEGNWKQKTYWNDVNLFGEMAKRVYDKYSNGSLVLIEGTLSKVKFNDKDGVERHSTSLIAKTIKLLKPSDGTPQKSMQDAIDESSKSLHTSH